MLPLQLLSDPNFQWVLGGTVLLGASSGLLGSFALLRRRSLMGDVLAHTALPGVCLAFLLTQSKSIFLLLVGAIAAGLVGAWCVGFITRHSRIKEDTAQGLVLTVFFGIGIVLLTYIGRTGAANQAGLDRFLFGQAASLVASDVRIIGAVGLLLCLITILLFKEFKLLCFDPGFGTSTGLPMRHLDDLLMLLIVSAVAIGLQAVGVVLMAAMLITPGLAARYWTDRLERMLLIAAIFGALAGVAGTVASASVPNLATGPVIVLAATAVFVFSLLVAPRRGVLWRGLRLLRLRSRVTRENILRALYERIELASDPKDPEPGWAVDIDELAVSRGYRRHWLLRKLRQMERSGLVTFSGKSEACRLTASGWAAAYRVVRRHRLWEVFLMHEADLAVDHVDRDADDIEHHLPAEVIQELETLLRKHHREPHLPRSVHPLEGA